MIVYRSPLDRIGPNLYKTSFARIDRVVAVDIDRQGRPRWHTSEGYKWVRPTSLVHIPEDATEEQIEAIKKILTKGGS